MILSDRVLLGIADRVHDQLSILRINRFNEVLERTTHVTTRLDTFRRTSRLLSICLGRGWSGAGNRLVRQMSEALRDLPHYVAEVDRMISACGPQPPSVSDCLADLRQLVTEFERVQYDDEENSLTVTTDPIQLEGVYLGEFEIRLSIADIPQLKHRRAIYTVVALNPHPAASNTSVTHPHVIDDHLCEGDAGAAIEAAVVTGRLCDFFQLINSVLTTYNSASPFVSLSEWDGEPCFECGYMMSANNIHDCSCCSHEFCGECISCCPNCERYVCGSCQDSCAACDAEICDACKIRCPDCGRWLCSCCLEDANCPCIEERQENQENQDGQEELQPCHIDPQVSGPVTASQTCTRVA